MPGPEEGCDEKDWPAASWGPSEEPFGFSVLNTARILKTVFKIQTIFEYLERFAVLLSPIPLVRQLQPL